MERLNMDGQNENKMDKTSNIVELCNKCKNGDGQATWPEEQTKDGLKDW